MSSGLDSTYSRFVLAIFFFLFYFSLSLSHSLSHSLSVCLLSQFLSLSLIFCAFFHGHFVAIRQTMLLIGLPITSRLHFELLRCEIAAHSVNDNVSDWSTVDARIADLLSTDEALPDAQLLSLLNLAASHGVCVGKFAAVP